jgi:hypothetical protein
VKLQKHSGAKLVRLSDLSDDLGLFQKDHGNACPGLVNVDFYGDGKPTLALVLIAKDGARGKACCGPPSWRELEHYPTGHGGGFGAGSLEPRPG